VELVLATFIVGLVEQLAIKGPDIIDDLGLSEQDAAPLKARLTGLFQQRQWKTDDQLASDGENG
jgi:hypothetical protein